MEPWNVYNERVSCQGSTKREHRKQFALERLKDKLPDTLSYKEISVDGEAQLVTIINTENYDTKIIHSMPGESIRHGATIDWNNNKWIVTEKDADNELYETGTIKQCNYLLKWINDKGEIIERWVIVIDGTKYLIGEKTEDIMAIGDARIAITLPKDSETSKLKRGNRFIVDDLDTNTPLAYQITKPNKLFNSYNNEGVFRFILNEVNLTDNDNIELRIADYYNWRPDLYTSPRENNDTSFETIVEQGNADLGIGEEHDGKRVWL